MGGGGASRGKPLLWLPAIKAVSRDPPGESGPHGAMGAPPMAVVPRCRPVGSVGSCPRLSSPCPSLLRAQPASLVGEGSQASLGFGNSRVKFPLGASLLAPHKNIRKATGGRLGPSLELSSQIWGRAQVVSSKCPDPLTMVYHLRSLLVRAWLGAHRYGSCRPGLGAEWGGGKGVGSKSSRHGGVRILAPPPVTSSRQDASSETPSQPVFFRSQSLWQPVSVCAHHLPLPLHLQLQDRGTVAPAT